MSFFNVLRTEVEIKAYKYVEDLAKIISDEAIEILETQRYDWKPLNPNYKNWKSGRGLDTRILISTGFYQDHIGWGYNDNGTIWVGVEDIIHKPSGLPLRTLARIHEFGTSVINARPLWRPLLSKWLRKDNRLAAQYRESIARKLKAARKKQFNRQIIKLRY